MKKKVALRELVPNPNPSMYIYIWLSGIPLANRKEATSSHDLPYLYVFLFLFLFLFAGPLGLLLIGASISPLHLHPGFVTWHSTPTPWNRVALPLFPKK